MPNGLPRLTGLTLEKRHNAVAQQEMINVTKLQAELHHAHV